MQILLVVPLLLGFNFAAVSKSGAGQKWECGHKKLSQNRGSFQEVSLVETVGS
jgi:hypothetical protein